MSTGRLGIIRVAIIGTVAIALGIGLVASVDTTSPSARAAEWVRANEGKLPTSLEALSEYPVKHRVAAFQAHSPEIQSKLAREHFAAIRRGHQLSTEQDALLQRLSDLATPSAYSETGRSAAQAEVAPLCVAIKEAFSPVLANAIGTLGPVERAEPQIVTVARWMQSFMTPSVSATGEKAENCSCSTDTWCPGCAIALSTCQNRGSCSPVGISCGCGFLWPCDGDCYSILEMNGRNGKGRP